MAEDPPTDAADVREREHARRNRLQKESLRREYRRSLHRAYIDAALTRFRQERAESHDSAGSGPGTKDKDTTG
jgi:hypothetical protein